VRPDTKKVIVLGLDGATFDVLLPRVERGQMPNLERLLLNSAWGNLQSTTPPFSAQAWVSMMTGKNQGRHGVVDFWQRPVATDTGTTGLDPGERRQFVTAQEIHGETLWHITSRYGLNTGVVNVPVTYPPAKIAGYMISGLLTPGGRDDFVHPTALKQEILDQVSDYNPDPFDPMTPSQRQVLELKGWMRKHEVVCRHLMENHPVDLFVSVVQALDHLQHLFWNDIADADSQSERANLIDDCYRMADEIIGHRLAALDEHSSLFLVSDHGFGPANKWFHVNRFLMERGLLVLGSPESGEGRSPLAQLGLTPQRIRKLVRRLDVLGLRRRMGRMTRVTLGRRIDQALMPPIDWSRTQAVSGSPATEGIFINSHLVESGAAYETLRERLMAELLALRDPEGGGPLVANAYRREELYNGPFLKFLPDVVFDLGDGPYLASDTLAATQIVEPLPDDVLQGRHRSNGIFIATGPGIEGGDWLEGLQIADVPPTVLYALDLPIPEDMDGRPLLELFSEDHRAANPVQYAPAEERSESAVGTDYSAEDAEEMERRLRGLGYMS
jgi:predicted AlkP superfamily phosphohydrolase/phosphomutase